MIYLFMNDFIHCILKKNIMDIYFINKVFIVFVIIY